ncbi:Basic leucine zipper 43 [Hibiscus syriacus]|uniref:Basic leucine zipper 43 n=1 Tax=Hibiscus syriacus TaxID=106335 RepID=A0A6A3BTK7_HIBSY|nr:basic leucine zipper 43-like [Hibiscus syriacus]KAE8719237.1 Basic leucine zipper 43 [Hibiscus syriacus]
MVPSELRGLHYLAPENPILIPSNLGMMQNSIPSSHFNTFFNSLPNPHITPSSLELTPLSSSISNNSTSDEAEEHQVKLTDERKQRRMISNRESARRSRMRKQKHLDELWSQVIRLRNENHNLIDKLNHVSESHDRVLQENARLKEEASDLRQMLSDIKIGSPYSLAFRELEEVPCNTAYLKAESINQSIANSVDLLH